VGSGSTCIPRRTMGFEPSQNRPSWADTWPVADPPGTDGAAPFEPGTDGLLGPGFASGTTASEAEAPAPPVPGAANVVMVKVAFTPSSSVSSVSRTIHWPAGFDGTVMVVFTVPSDPTTTFF